MHVEIECCENCGSHTWCTKHDESKYKDHFSQICSLCSDTLGLEVKVMPKPRMGAFEVRLVDDGFNLLIFSKFRNLKWPSVDLIERKIRHFIESDTWKFQVELKADDYTLGVDLPGEPPFVITRTHAGSVAKLVGVEGGDILQEVDGKEVPLYLSHLEKLMEKRPVTLTIVRKRNKPLSLNKPLKPMVLKPIPSESAPSVKLDVPAPSGKPRGSIQRQATSFPATAVDSFIRASGELEEDEKPSMAGLKAAAIREPLLEKQESSDDFFFGGSSAAPKSNGFTFDLDRPSDIVNFKPKASDDDYEDDFDH
jgi:Rdx family